MNELEVLNFQLMMIQIWGWLVYLLLGMSIILTVVCLIYRGTKSLEIPLVCLGLIVLFHFTNPTSDMKEVSKYKERKSVIESSVLYKVDFQKILLNQDLTHDEEAIKALIKLEAGKEYGVFTTKHKSEGEVMKEYMEGQARLTYEIEQINKIIKLLEKGEEID